jgi:hypothetical protein
LTCLELVEESSVLTADTPQFNASFPMSVMFQVLDEYQKYSDIVHEFSPDRFTEEWIVAAQEKVLLNAIKTTGKVGTSWQ